MKSKVLLLSVCLLYLFTRLYKISEIPVSLYWDEASIGYNAYSIAETGRDEWGKFLPIHFRAFGEFKLPVFIYSVVPFIKILGLNEFSVRLPALIYSLGVVLLTFLLARKFANSGSIGLWSSFLLVISPWFFIFSRTGYEATAGLMFYMLGIYLFLKYLEKRWCILILTTCFILSAYSYNSFRIISPLTTLLLIFFERSNFIQILKRQKIAILVSAIFVILAIVPIFRLFVYDTGAGRLQSVSSSLKTILPNFLSHFNPHFLFISGDKNLRSQQAGFGELNLAEVILLPLGLFGIRKIRYGMLLVFLTLIGPIPAAITKESPHALRAIVTIPFISIIAAIGVGEIKNYIKQKYILEVALVSISLIFFTNYFINFINFYPSKSAANWQYGYKSIFTNLRNQVFSYDHVIISDEYAQPYIFGLFYLKYDPNKFRQEVMRNSVDQWGFSTVKSFNKFVFGKVSVLNLPSGRNLVFASPKEKIPGVLDKGVILNLDNSVAFYIYDYKK